MSEHTKKRLVNPSHLTDDEKQKIISFIAANSGASVQDICHHMGIPADDQNPNFVAVKHFLLDALEKDQVIRHKNHQTYSVSQNIGYIVARYMKPKHSKQPPQLRPVTWPEDTLHNKPAFINLDRTERSPLNPFRLNDGELVVVKVKTQRANNGELSFKAITALKPNIDLTAIIEKNSDGLHFLCPANGSKTFRLPVQDKDLQGAKEGDIVVFNLDSKSYTSLESSPQIKEILGQKLDWDTISPTVANEFKLSQTFNEMVMKEMDNLADPNWTTANRTDLTHIPYVTIDDVTTTDMDDAIYAAPTYDDKGKQTGWFISVAIADVAQYIPAGSAIDKEARFRGNTNYLPGFRCDMIPTDIATEKASLVPDELRSALVMNMNISMDGRLRSYKLQRGLIRSRAKLHHQQVEDAIAGNPDADIMPYLDEIKNLYAAYKPLADQSEKRKKLPIESKEQKIVFDTEGKFVDIVLKDYMEINKVIEEYMVLANMCAAKILKSKGYPAPHRNHQGPSEKRMITNAAILEELGYSLDVDESQEGIRRQLIKILKDSKDTPEMEIVHQLVTMLQSRAEYDTDEEVGHYGLGLDDYAHFTSPIRRYADLDVHRKLISACKLGSDGLPKSIPVDKVQEMAEHISSRENIAKRAEREARARFCQAWVNREIRNAIANDNRKEYEAIITDISEAGLQVKLSNNGVTGFIPVELLPGDARYRYVKELKMLVSRFEADRQSFDNAYQQGARLSVRVSLPLDDIGNNGDFEPVDFSLAVLPKYEQKTAEIIDLIFDPRYDKKKRKKLKQKSRNHGKKHFLK